MCKICEGATVDEVMDGYHTNIVDHGFALVGVGSASKGWAYTIGLVAGGNHPELVVAGCPLSEAGWVLSELATGVVEDGLRIDELERALTLTVGEVGVVPVHEQHLRSDLLAFWHGYYGRLGGDLELSALQVVLADDVCCFEHQSSQPWLDDPRHVPYDGTGRQLRRKPCAPVPVARRRRR